MKGIALLTLLLLLSGCIFFESVTRKGFEEDDLTYPLPYYLVMEKKPESNSILSPPLIYNLSWQFGKLYSGYKGTVRMEIENKGKGDIFVYGFSIKIGDEEQKTKFNYGKKIERGEKENFVFSFDCSLPGEYEYRIGLYLMTGLGNKWYDHGLRYIDKIGEIEVKDYIKANYKLHKNYYIYFDKINEMVNPDEKIIREKASEIASNYGKNYNIAQVCAIYEWIYENVEYKNDTDDKWTSPSYAILCGGDCEEFAMLFSAMVNAIGGTTRIYITDNHAFSSVYIGKNLDLLDSINSYYGSNLTYAFLEDEFGYWLVADPLSSFYLGGLPVGGVVEEKNNIRYYRWSIVTNELYSIDVLR
ncbi:MAG TPA: transglutaminase domain-containing protein [Thermoplasmatales archaeon]|nr:transglutaminase domain-containing protein [Thermoplasmatales archaeon]